VGSQYVLGLDAIDQTSILKEIAHFKLKLVPSISATQVERDLNNEATLDLAPLMMSFQLVEMTSCNFIDSILDPY